MSLVEKRKARHHSAQLFEDPPRRRGATLTIIDLEPPGYQTAKPHNSDPEDQRRPCDDLGSKRRVISRPQPVDRPGYAGEVEGE